MLRLIAGQDDDQRRLDRILRKNLPNFPLSLLHRLLREGKITVDSVRALPGDRIKTGQLIEVPESFNNQSREINHISISKEQENPSSLEIIYNGSGLLILNKPAGLTVHGPNSLEEQVFSYLKPILPPSLSFKPGPLHRLDKGTSGIIVFSTSLIGAQTFSVLLREGKIQKQYLAIVDGEIEGEKIWNDELLRNKKLKKTFPSQGIKNYQEKSKNALSKIKVLAIGRDHSLILVEIETGRTHQIRAQAGIHGHPLTGDRKYGSKKSGNFLLHAWKLDAGPLDLKFQAPLPSDFQKKIIQFYGKNVLYSLQ